MKTTAAFLNRHLPDLCFLIFAIAATIGAFIGGMWAALGIGFALIAFFSVWLIEGCAPKPDMHILYFILTFFTIAALLNLDSWQPKLSWSKWGQLVTIFLPLSLLTAPSIQKHTTHKNLFLVLPGLAIAGAAALGIELALHAPLLKWWRGPEADLPQYNRGFSYLVILSFPIMAALWTDKRRALLWIFIAVLFVPASLTESRAAKLALILGLITILVAHFRPVLTRRLLMLVPIAVVGWPFAAQKFFLAQREWIERLPRSWEDRMEIWDYMSYRILDRPKLGWGLGTSPKLPFAEPHGALYRCELYGAAHPHNAVIQLWVELGLPGLALGILFALLVLQWIGRLKSEIVPFALGAWITAFCLSMIAYDFWTDSLWAASALTGFAFALLQRPNSRN